MENSLFIYIHQEAPVRFFHASLKVVIQPVEVLCNTCICAWIARCCALLSKRHYSNQIELSAFIVDERATRVSLARILFTRSITSTQVLFCYCYLAKQIKNTSLETPSTIRCLSYTGYFFNSQHYIQYNIYSFYLSLSCHPYWLLTSKQRWKVFII